jgi:hypothetical protein
LLLLLVLGVEEARGRSRRRDWSWRRSRVAVERSTQWWVALKKREGGGGRSAGIGGRSPPHRRLGMARSARGGLRCGASREEGSGTCSSAGGSYSLLSLD